MNFADLKSRVQAITKLFDQADAARRLPDARYNDAMRLSLEYDHTRRTAETNAFNKIRGQYAAEERRQGEIARDRELKRIAAEMERLRADLPELAAAARFDLLDTIRELRHG